MCDVSSSGFKALWCCSKSARVGCLREECILRPPGFYLRGALLATSRLFRYDNESRAIELGVNVLKGDTTVRITLGSRSQYFSTEPVTTVAEVGTAEFGFLSDRLTSKVSTSYSRKLLLTFLRNGF